MASQISHIVYAKKYFDAMESGDINDSRFENFLPEEKINRDEFFLGSVFPDIRRIEPSIKRQITHLHFPEVNLDFRGLNSFEAGWKFHLFCDMRREDILNRKDFYSISNAADFFHHPAKILEDELVYEEYDNWEKISGFFNNPPEIKLNMEITNETFRLWYAILSKYVEKRPSDQSMKIFLSKQPRLAKDSEAIINSVKKIRESETAKKILFEVHREIL